MSDNGIPQDPTVVTTVAFTIAALIKNFHALIPDLKFVYDERLSYETAVARFRANNVEQGSNEDFYPCLAFKRSVLRHDENNAPGKRAIAMQGAARPIGNNISELYQFIQGTFDFEFQLYTKSAIKLEEFEIKYLSENGISQFKQFTVDLTPNLGGLQNYFANYGPLLDDKSFSIEDKYYKILSGKIAVRGFYYVLTGSAPVITSILKRIRDLNTEILYEQETILP